MDGPCLRSGKAEGTCDVASRQNSPGSADDGSDYDENTLDVRGEDSYGLSSPCPLLSLKLRLNPASASGSKLPSRYLSTTSDCG